ncbi:phage major capsid protein [Seohaeicola nanhaiensis]|uniref:Phage major capsid protein n=1 Tax=Seohaeicola nanhaiensis TaxID=1387282 RepID=A0ABV9KP52_9RHOB
MTIQNRPVSTEIVASGALLPWLARSKALLSQYPGRGVAGTAEALGAPLEIIERIKAAVAAETVAGQPGLAGSSTAVTAFVAQAAETSVLFRMLADSSVTAAPMQTWLATSVMAATATEIDEGKPIPLQALNMRRDKLEAFKVAALIATTAELWTATSGEGQAFISHLLRAAAAEAADRALFQRLTNSGTFEATDYGSDLDAIRQMIEGMLSAVHTGAFSRLYWALSPKAWNWLVTMPNLPDSMNPFDGMILGRPAVLSDGLDPWRMALVNARAIGSNLERVEIAASGQATIQMLDNPTNDTVTPTATNAVSMFQTNGRAVRMILHLAAQPLRENAIAFATITEPTSI